MKIVNRIIMNLTTLSYHVRTVHSLNRSLSDPSFVAYPVDCHPNQTGEENDDNEQRSNILPTNAPVNTSFVADHELQVSFEPGKQKQ